MKGIYSFLLILLMVYCQENPYKKKQKKNTKKELATEVKNENLLMEQDTVEGSIGLITLADNYSEKDTIRILNDNGSLWYKFSLFYDDSNGKFDFFNKGFSPIAFHPDYFLLVMGVLEKQKNMYKVLVNDKNNLKKWIEVSNFLQFQSWEDHILSVYLVDFNQDKNPLLQNPSENSNKVYHDKSEDYHPVQIKGQWLQVKWGSKGNWKYGWIKWKEEEKLLIELFYFA